MSEKVRNLKVWSPSNNEMSRVMTNEEFIAESKSKNPNPIVHDPKAVVKYESPLKTSEGNSLFENDYVSIENRLNDYYIIGLVSLTPDGFIIQNVFNHTDITDLLDIESSVVAKIGSVEETPTLVVDLLTGI